MSDTLNQLLQPRAGALPAPVVVNPLAAIGGAAETAGRVMNLRNQQGQQLWGQALQQATDANGNVDFGKAQSIAAGMGPAAAMAASANLQANATMRGQQINNAAGIYKTTGIAALNVAKDPSDGGVNSAFDNMIASGLPATEVNAERQRVLAMSPTDRQNYAVQHGLSVLDQLHQVIGQTTLQNFGNVAAPATVYQPTPNAPGSVKVAPGVTVGPSPDLRTPVVAPFDDKGQIPLDANGNPTRPPKTWQPTSVPGSPGVPGGGQQVTAPPASGGPPQPPPPPSGTQPRVASPGAYRPPGSVATPTTTTPPAPVTSTPLPPPPAQTPQATTPPPATPPAVSTPPGAVATSAPMGTEDTLKNDITARTEASTGQRTQQNVLQAGESALEALRLAKGYTGPGTGTTSRMYAFLQAHDPTGALPQADLSDTAWRQVLAKNLLRFAQNSGLRGNTDLGLTEQLKGSANVDDMLPAANEEVLLKDIGRQRQFVAQTQLMPQPSASGDVVNHLKNYSSNTDPRGFVWDLYSQPQRDAIEAEAKQAGPQAVQRLTKAIHDGMTTGLVKPPSAPAAAPAANSPPPAVPTTGMASPNQLIPPTNYAAAAPNALAA